MTKGPETAAHQPTRPASPRELQELIAAQRKGQPFVAYHDRDGGQFLRELAADDGPVTVGRAQEADLSVEWDDQISRFHAEFEPVGNEWAVVDDGLSTNGTFVNGRRISGRRRLADHDVVRLGTTSFTYHHPTQQPDFTTVRAGRVPSVEDLSPMQRRVLLALCRPYKNSDSFVTPATNQQIADEVFLSVDAVKNHLRILCNRFGLDDLKQNRKRATLAEVALQWGLVARRDL